jgi:hypothetical protein
MARVPITVMGYRCERCDHEWIPRDQDHEEPRECPRCRRVSWNTPRKQPATTYDFFKARIQSALGGSGRGLTWTEIRTTARLPQKLPNNQWVRRLEQEIGLRRVREHGVIIWRLAGTKEG